MTIEDEKLGADIVEHGVFLDGLQNSTLPTPPPTPISKAKDQSRDQSSTIPNNTTVISNSSKHKKQKIKKNKDAKIKTNGIVAPLYNGTSSTPKYAWSH